MAMKRTMALLVLLVLTGCGGSAAVTATPSSSSGPPPTYSARAGCVDSVLDILNDMVAENIQAATDVSGADSPEYHIAKSLLDGFQTDRVQYGLQTAAVKAFTFADQACREELQSEGVESP